MSETLLTFAQVSARVALKRTAIYAGIAGKSFPRPIKSGARSLWVESEIDSWIEERIRERDVGSNVGNQNAA